MKEFTEKEINVIAGRFAIDVLGENCFDTAGEASVEIIEKFKEGFAFAVRLINSPAMAAGYNEAVFRFRKGDRVKQLQQKHNHK